MMRLNDSEYPVSGSNEIAPKFEFSARKTSEHWYSEPVARFEPSAGEFVRDCCERSKRSHFGGDALWIVRSHFRSRLAYMRLATPTMLLQTWNQVRGWVEAMFEICSNYFVAVALWARDVAKRCCFAFVCIALATIASISAPAYAQSSTHTIQPDAGDPLPDLTDEQLQRFVEGRIRFATPVTIEEGLGPIFNKASCGACHNAPLGGAGTVTVVNFGSFSTEDGFDPFIDVGGPVLQVSTIHEECREFLPNGANNIRPRLTLGTMGFGLIEAIPEADLHAYVAEIIALDNGISPEAHMVQGLEHQANPDAPLRIGRFGWKAQAPDVLAFTAGAAFNELGLTSPFHPEDNVANALPGQDPLCDTVADPELPDPTLDSTSFIAQTVDFQRFMAQPPQTPRIGMTGEAIFTQVGCDICHKPEWTTSSDPALEEALRSKVIRPYTDLMLHEMGSRLRDKIVQGDANGSEFRTPALWNLRVRPRLLHDGRANSSDFETRVRLAIQEHGGGGEANRSRRDFNDLSDADQMLMIDFLGSLGRREFDMDGDGDIDGEDLAAAEACLGATVTPDDACAVADLDANGIVDPNDLTALYDLLGLVQDCNGNGINDETEIAAGLCRDTNEDGIPDECENLDCDQRLVRYSGPGGDIPDGFGAFIETVVVAEDLGEIVSVRLQMEDVHHGWSEELTVTLAHLSNGLYTEVVISQNCGVAWNWNGTYRFRDDGERFFCPSGPFDSNFDLKDFTYESLELLAGFAGESTEGEWILTVEDAVEDNEGTIGSWSVDFVIAVDHIDCDGNGVHDACDLDTDGDGAIDACDGCPDDTTRIHPGACGCNGPPETDSDADGTPDCADNCPNDPTKFEPGVCGCDSPDIDSDADGTLDCLDGCPFNPLLLEPGVCGCDDAVDTDEDGLLDCDDGCPEDPLKIEPGICGCGEIDEGDSDADGTLDCADECPTDPNKSLAGDCGCFEEEIDSDGDATSDCVDECPNDPNKTLAGDCGCFEEEIDTDADGTSDCIDNCPNDPERIEPGECGCNASDADIDGDGTIDCHDGCPEDAGKTEPGVCGCGVADIDTDEDGMLDCLDGCPSDPFKIAPGDCGCGVSEADADSDGAPDCIDNCPADPAKTEPGLCGCGAEDTDTDSDGTADCNDSCPTDADKIEPGLCGCGVPDNDADSDGTADCVDGCPDDPLKTTAGACGCGVSDGDTDGDGAIDCEDGCPFDAAKFDPGACGCGVADDDSDADGTLDCNDGCPDDALKTDPGACGCGIADDDTDGDGTADCNDGCPDDALKIEEGVCGCGIADDDSDGDGTADCNDGCPDDALKIEEGVCGCGVADDDSDGDGTADCIDECPDDAMKIEAGACGCGISDDDSDGDGTADCEDGCPDDALKIEEGACGCGIADDDSDGDGTADCNDGCPDDALKIEEGACGCGVADDDSDGDGTADCLDGCVPMTAMKTEAWRLRLRCTPDDRHRR